MWRDHNMIKQQCKGKPSSRTGLKELPVRGCMEIKGGRNGYSNKTKDTQDASVILTFQDKGEENNFVYYSLHFQH